MVKGVPLIIPKGGPPNADEIMPRGVLLPLSHAINDETLEFVLSQLDEFLQTVSS